MDRTAAGEGGSDSGKVYIYFFAKEAAKTNMQS